MRNLNRLSQQFFKLIWRLVSTFPRATVAVAAILALCSALFSFLYLGLNSDQDRLVSPEAPFHKRYLAHIKNFGDQEYLYVVILTGETEDGMRRAEQFAEVLAGRLKKSPELIHAIYYRLSTNDLGPGALYYASLKELKTLTETITFLAPPIKAWLQDGSISDLLNSISNLLETGPSALAGADPELSARFLGKLSDFTQTIENELAGSKEDSDLLQVGLDETRYFFTANKRLLVMKILPDKNFSTLDVIGKPLEAVRTALQETRKEFPDVQAGLTGRPVLQADEMRTTNQDMTRASIIAVIVVAVMFIIFLHGWLRPLLIVVTLLMATAWTFGFALITVGELNLLSIVFVLVLVGIGVDFGVHIVTRYVESGNAGMNVEDSIRISLLRTGPGVLLGCLTSVCAFYAVLGSEFRGLAELGLIGGTGVLFCLIAMVTVLPALLLLTGKRSLFAKLKPRVIRMRFLERVSSHPLILLMFLAAVSLASLPGLFETTFSYNLLKLQAKGLEAVEYENILINDSDESTWYAIFTAPSLERVKQLVNRIEKLPGVGSVESILQYIPEKQKEKAELLHQASQALKGIDVSQEDRAPVDASRLIESLDRLSLKMEDLEEKLFAAGAKNELAVISQAIKNLQDSVGILKKDPSSAQRLGGLQKKLYEDLVKSLGKLESLLQSEGVTPQDLPPAIRHIFVGKDGRFQIKVNPNENVWEFDKLNQFVSRLRTIDPEVSGVPVGVLESARLMRRTFLSAAGITLILVSLLLWFASGSLTAVMLTLLPLGVSILWLLEFMGLIGLNFNLANFFAIPILIAIGVDGGVHFLARWKELEGRESLFSTTTPTAVTLSFMTTMIGFGGLLFAHHRGLASLGAVMVLGSLFGALSCLLVLPAILKLLLRSFFK